MLTFSGNELFVEEHAPEFSLSCLLFTKKKKEKALNELAWTGDGIQVPSR